MRTFRWLLFFILISILAVYISEAGLLKPKKPPAPAAPAQEPVQPLWKKQAPTVKNAAEKRYDINRDGILQTAETKIYLRDVTDIVESKGGLTINSDILKEYDKNKDGVISKTEVTEIKDHTSN